MARSTVLLPLLLALGLALAAGACAPSSPASPGIFTNTASDVFRTLPLPELDWTGTLVAEDAPSRIVSLIPSVTELIHVLGLGDRLVGRSHWCDWPPEVARLPDLGRLQNVSKERIVDLRPDIVIMFGSQDDLARSLERDFDIRVLQPPTESHERIFEGMRSVAAALGVPERGARLAAELERRLADVRAIAPSAHRPRVLVVLDRNPIFVPGRGSFVDSLLEAAGAENVAATLTDAGPWPTVTVERVMDWAPEVIVDLSIGDDPELSRREAARFWSAFPGIPAVRDGRVEILEAGVLVRPGPRIAAAAARLRELLHGDSGG